MFSNTGFNNSRRHIRNNKEQRGVCVCPKCGYTVAHDRGVPCSSKSCPVCKTWLVRKDDESMPQDTLNQLNASQTGVKHQQNTKLVEYPIVDAELCIGCGICIDICPTNAIVLKNDKAFIINDLCRNCKKCVRACPSGAIQ